jgi:hypothetical protein
VNGGTSAERLQAAIASIPDLNGLGTMIPDVPAHSPVEARCKMCKRRIAAVAKTDEGPLYLDSGSATSVADARTVVNSG